MAKTVSRMKQNPPRNHRRSHTEYPQEAKVNTEGMINTKYKIPYAVQYKESDYRFISRLARRYGEFFLLQWHPSSFSATKHRTQ